jgi:ABC-type glutathione transport system ATPase component
VDGAAHFPRLWFINLTVLTCGIFDGQGLTEAERLENVHLAAEAAQLGETIRVSLPNGLDTTIGERSEHDLSDGQTQRLAIARCATAIAGTAVGLLH